jgi:hypothetical protein
MFRLIKLAMYAIIGYALYEMYQGVMQQQGGRSFGGGNSGGGGGAFGGGSSGSFGAMTGGAGTGMIETAADVGGAVTPHRVGRGVISPSSTL